MSSPNLPRQPGARRSIGSAEHAPAPDHAPGVDPAIDLAPDEVLEDGTTWEDVLATGVEAGDAEDPKPDGYRRERQRRTEQRGEAIEPDSPLLSRGRAAPAGDGIGAAPTVALPAPVVQPAAPPAAAVAPAAAEGREPSAREWLSRRWLFGLTYWQALLMGGLLVALVLTRFYDLGVRAMHHDESMHAKFAWDTFHGQIYKYNPLLHGPFQFLAVAASFWLFGATEWTARAVPAMFGILLVLLTFFWRRWLGALGWLFAVAIFVFSPSFTYFARMLREDSYTATWTLLAATGFAGYVLHRGRPWYYAFCAGLAMAFATKESTYITAFIFGTFMICSLLWEQGGQLQRRLVAGAAAGGILGTFYSMVMDQPLFGLHKKDLHEVGGAFIGLAIGTAVALAYHALQPSPRPAGAARRASASAARAASRRSAASAAPAPVRPARPRGTFTTALLTLWRDDAGGLWGMGTFWTGVLLFAALYILFFSSFFTNLPGIREGLIGSITYWLEQHSVQRGNQPWYYYLLILSAYETLEWVFAFVATIYYLRRPTWLTSFLIWWWVLAVVIYSWAGEKMPWLVIHIALPMVLLTARYLGELFTSAARSLWEKRLALAGLAVLGVWTIHTGWPVNFERPDTPKDLLVYTQTAPDVKKVVADIERLSLEQTGDAHAIGITVQSGTWWPFSWYLRDFKNVDYPAQLTAPATKPIVLVAVEDDDKNRPFLQGYTRTRYKMRWWYPEDYRNITLQTIFDLFSPSPQGQAVRAGLWNWLIYREPTQPLGSYDFYVYLKEGLASPSAGTEPAPAVPASQAPLAQQQSSPAQQPAFANPVEYAAKVVPLAMLAQWGSAGKAGGQLNTPRAIALDSQGNVYVADSLNHRIQKFDPTGKLLFAWGTQGGGDGQFNEPMGVAVDAEGNVYVADTWNHRIQKFDPAGKLLTKWTGQGGFWGPRAVALDGQGNVYVMDTGNKRIQKFDANGRYLSTIGSGGSGPGQLNEPIGMAVTAAGEVYVADTNNHRIEKFDAAGQFVAQWPVAGWNGNVRNEPYLTLDTDGNLYVTDPPNGRIIKFSPTGEVLAVAGTPGNGPGQLSLPTGIAAGPDRLYIADTGNNRIQVVVPLP